MKPCPEKLQIALLAMGHLEADAAERLRAHIGCCAGCREYLKEIADVSELLEKAPPVAEVEAGSAFHEQLVRRIQADAQQPRFSGIVDFISRFVAQHHVATVAAAFAAIVLVMVVSRKDEVQVAQRMPNPPSIAAAAHPQTQSAQTYSAYRHAASVSPEVLDELLAKQALKSMTSSEMLSLSSLSRFASDN